MFTVKIDDDFCEWSFELDDNNEGNYSIDDLIALIINNSNLVIISEPKVIREWSIYEKKRI